MQLHATQIGKPTVYMHNMKTFVLQILKLTNLRCYKQYMPKLIFKHNTGLSDILIYLPG